MYWLRTLSLALWKNGALDQVSQIGRYTCIHPTHTKKDDLYATNPSLIYTRISGYGQTGPYSKRPGFASVCEGMGGFRYVNGVPGEAPVRPNISLGDSLAGMHAAMGVLLGLIGRSKLPASKTGQVVDVAIYESMLNMMESIIPEYDRKGVVCAMIFMVLCLWKLRWKFRLDNLLDPLLPVSCQQTRIHARMGNMWLSVVMVTASTSVLWEWLVVKTW